MQLHFFDERRQSEPTPCTSVGLNSQAQAPSQPQPPPLLPDDLGTESPVQVCLQSYPGRMFNGRKHPANKILQAKETDLYTGLKLVHSVCECIKNLRCDSEFDALWAQYNDGQNAMMGKRTVKPLLDLTKTETVDAEFTVARRFIRAEITLSNRDKWTTLDVLQNFSGALSAMPTVYIALRLRITFGAFTAICENSFSILNNVFTQHRRSMSHQRKAQLIQLAFECDLTAKFKEKEWHDRLLRRFSAKSKRLQLF
ncbi:hypothetical protein DPX16_22487 [Anabarilius grahami]|uniref:HAT C-terminal dimerisation domain-containing protein n=1 Tax=Anabarilius grahami TaxID=495550 RepID=A0A3N0YZD0_ANAGA|nr:hypothetical protein DPX16_22487 [Anabarilius grahami]